MTSLRYAFILRVWAEVDMTLPQISWRGSLQTADGEALRYFDSLPKLIAMLAAMTGWDDDPQLPSKNPRNEP